MIRLQKNAILPTLVIAVGVFVLVYVGKIGWGHAEALLIGLVFPSTLAWRNPLFRSSASPQVRQSPDLRTEGSPDNRTSGPTD